jgi:putative heme-binding domain-containing protein
MRIDSNYWWKWLLTTGLFSLGTLSLISTLSFIYFPASAEDAGTVYNTSFDINSGERYFERQCSRCHGFDAKGNDETGAPDLTGRLARASTDAGIFNIIRSGVPGTAMLPVADNVPDPTIWQLVAYLDSLRYDPDSVILDGSADSGVALFTGKGDCDSCHMVNGQGGRLGPDLSRIGERNSPEDLSMAMLGPDDAVAPRWWTLKITGPDGEMREGFRMNEDSFSLRIMDNDANLWSFRKSQIQSYERVEESTMPSYERTMSESEIDDLVAYLFSLRKEI